MKKKKKENRKLRIQNRNQKYELLKNHIKEYSDKIPLYNIFFDNQNDVSTNSFYNMKEYNVDKHDNNMYNFKNNIDNTKNRESEYTYCKKIILEPTLKQEKIISSMLDGYRIIYNKTLKFIKTRIYNKNMFDKNNSIEKVIVKKEKKTKNEFESESLQICYDLINDFIEISIKKAQRKEKIEKLLEDNNNDIVLDSKIIRTYFLKEEIKQVSKIYKTPIHTLAYAVQLACASFKSCITNQKNGNIKNFNIRYIKSTKRSLIMDIEKQSFRNKGFFVSILGNEIKNKSNFDYKVDSDCKLHYNNNTNTFTLLVPYKRQIQELKDNSDFICIDPGIKPFLNCITKDKYIKIGDNIKSTLKMHLKRLDKYEFCSNIKVKNKVQNRIRESIKNKMNDVHWKTSHYLSNNYKNIIIGKWSTKSVIETNGVLSNMLKRICQNLSFYKFLQKLEYKCKSKKVNLQLEEEWYTSKTCTKCCCKNENLGGSKIFNCSNCGIKIDRDYNGCRNIFLKSISSIKNYMGSPLLPLKS